MKRWLTSRSRKVAFYRLTRITHPSRSRIWAVLYALEIDRRVRRRERQEGKLPIRFRP